MFYILIRVWATWVYTFVKTQTVLLKSLQFTICKLCLNKREIRKSPLLLIKMAKIQNINNTSVVGKVPGENIN